MTTALDLITDAMFEIGAADVGQSIPADEAALCLRYLNRILERWSNTRLAFPVLDQIDVTLNGAASYTVGPTGGTVDLRPISIESATATDSNGTEYQVNVLSRLLWDAIVVKDVTGGPPSDIWYEALNTDGKVYVYPKASGYTLKLVCKTKLASFATLNTSLTLPEGYESALVFTLARELCGPFRVPVTQELKQKAAGAVSAIKRTNAEPVLLNVGLYERQDYRIERGY